MSVNRQAWTDYLRRCRDWDAVSQKMRLTDEAHAGGAGLEQAFGDYADSLKRLNDLWDQVHDQRKEVKT